MKKSVRKQNASKHTIGVARVVVNNMQIFKSSKMPAEKKTEIRVFCGRAALESASTADRMQYLKSTMRIVSRIFPIRLSVFA